MEVRKGPPTMAPVGPMNVVERHEVELVQTSGGWKVAKFDATVEKSLDR